jgi:hypothetical protein
MPCFLLIETRRASCYEKEQEKVGLVGQANCPPEDEFSLRKRQFITKRITQLNTEHFVCRESGRMDLREGDIMLRSPSRACYMNGEFI